MSVSRLVSRPIRIRGKKTTIKLEPEYWDLLDEICAHTKTNRNTMVYRIKAASGDEGLLASAIRVHILMYYYRRLSDSTQLASADVSGVNPSLDSEVVTASLQ